MKSPDSPAARSNTPARRSSFQRPGAALLVPTLQRWNATRTLQRPCFNWGLSNKLEGKRLMFEIHAWVCSEKGLGHHLSPLAGTRTVPHRIPVRFKKHFAGLNAKSPSLEFQLFQIQKTEGGWRPKCEQYQAKRLAAIVFPFSRRNKNSKNRIALGILAHRLL